MISEIDASPTSLVGTRILLEAMRLGSMGRCSRGSSGWCLIWCAGWLALERSVGTMGRKALMGYGGGS
jgi:hypothetical protein